MICIDCRDPRSVALPGLTMCDRCLEQERNQLLAARSLQAQETRPEPAPPPARSRPLL